MMASDPAATFRQEVRELLDQLEQALLDMGDRPDDAELIDGAFRALHTIKGSGAMFGFETVAKFVHQFETAFDQVRKGNAAASPALVAVALEAKDHIHRLIQEPDAEGGAEILATLDQVVGSEMRADAAATKTKEAAGPAPALAATRVWRIAFRLPASALESGANPLLLLDEIRDLGVAEVQASVIDVPPLECLSTEVCHFAWQIRLMSEHPREAIEDVFLFLRDDMDLTVEEEAAAAPPGATASRPEAAQAAVALGATAAPQAASAARVKAETFSPSSTPKRRKTDFEPEGERMSLDKGNASVRVPAERLDELMDRVGELVIAQARLNQIAYSSKDSAFMTIAEELERLSSGLRDTTMGIRMVPIGTIFGRFRRLLYDLARDLKKEMDFVTSGEETELDKTVIERLADPLVHLIRNAADHGLESPADRVRAGKPVKGTVRLAAVHAGGEVAITITDDGAGLDAARIRAKAEESGLVTPEAKLTDAEIYQFLFHPGFSTAREVTALSGRGVGMDVVKRTIESLRGTIDLSTRPGQGTTISLRLPLTMAIIDGMLVRVGNGRFTIPLSAVEECVELPPDIDMRASGRSFLNIRGSLVPFLRLRELFKTTVPADCYPKVVIVSSGEFRVGLVVDQIIGNNQTVIKSLSKLHSGLKCFSGATILGDGTVALILDIPHLVSFGQAHEERLRGRAA